MNLGLPLNKYHRALSPRLLSLAGSVALFLLLLTGCETLDSRLTRNQGVLKNLPAEHQSLIHQGRIQVGFTQTEVYLAWGAPTHKAFTENAQGSAETWFYTVTQTETYYREERYYDRRFDVWRYVDRPYQRYLEYIFQEAVFSNGALSSFTIYPSYKPYSEQSLR